MKISQVQYTHELKIRRNLPNPSSHLGNITFIPLSKPLIQTSKSPLKSIRNGNSIHQILPVFLLNYLMNIHHLINIHFLSKDLFSGILQGSDIEFSPQSLLVKLLIFLYLVYPLIRLVLSLEVILILYQEGGCGDGVIRLWLILEGGMVVY